MSGKQKPRRARGRDVATRQNEDGSFEILVDGVDPSPGDDGASQRSNSSSGTKKRRLAAAGVVIILLVGGLALAGLFGDDEPSSPSSLSMDPAPGFEPYRGTVDLPVEEPAEVEPAVVAVEPDLEPSQEPEEGADEEYDRESDWRISEHDVIGRQPDGETIFADNIGEPMSRREAQMRAERQIESIENAQHQFERRMRQRDAILNSRILEPSDGGARVSPEVKLSQDIQRQLEKHFPTRMREGQSDANFIDDPSQYYDDHFYDESDEVQ